MTLISLKARAHFADGVLDEALAAEARALGLERPLVISDRGVAAVGLADRAVQAIAAQDPVLFVAADPRATVADALAAAERYAGDDCDGLIALGGAGVIDLAKAVGVLATSGMPIARFASGAEGGMRLKTAIPPLIAVPTTAGSGTQLDGGAVVRDLDGGQFTLHSPLLRPVVTICDPTVTLTLSAKTTAHSGMDAIAHCVEAFASPAFNPPADGVALDGLTRAALHLGRAVASGADRTARREMMASALNGALALAKGLGSAHAATIALHGVVEDRDVSLGALKSVLLPHVLVFNEPAAGPRYGALNRSLGAPCSADLPTTIAKLSAGLGMPSGLAQLGIDEAAIERAAPLAEQDRANSTNPRRATTEDYRRIMRAAL